MQKLVQLTTVHSTYEEMVKAIFVGEQPLDPMNDSNLDLLHLTNGLTAEAGEVAGLFQKYGRSSGHTPLDRNKLKKELGDVLWYLAGLAVLYGMTIEEIAQANEMKLMDRQLRRVIEGSGDDR